MALKLGLTIVDVTDEATNHSISGIAVTAANYDAQVALIAAYDTALQNIIIGELQVADFHADIFEISSALPTNNFAQRELKLLIRYQGDTNGDIFTISIGCPDLANLTLLGSTDFIDLADGGIMAAWVTAFEALARVPGVPGETVTVLSAQIVGRNI